MLVFESTAVVASAICESFLFMRDVWMVPFSVRENEMTRYCSERPFERTIKNPLDMYVYLKAQGSSKSMPSDILSCERSKQ